MTKLVSKNQFSINHGSHLKTKNNSNFAVNFTEMLIEATIRFCLFDERILQWSVLFNMWRWNA